jgi:type VI secretion system protein ImpE
MIRLARRTTWEEVAPEVFHGLGQRILATDAGQHSLLDVRSISVGAASAGDSEGRHG